MDSNDLTSAQVDQGQNTLYPHINDLVRLKTRGEKRRFPLENVYRLTVENDEACQSLSHNLHSMSCSETGEHSACVKKDLVISPSL
jgi:hypothetical protein